MNDYIKLNGTKISITYTSVINIGTYTQPNISFLNCSTR